MSKNVVAGTEVKLCPHCSVEKDKQGRRYPIVEQFCPRCDKTVLMRACPHLQLTRHEFGLYKCNRCGVTEGGVAVEKLAHAWAQCHGVAQKS